MQSMISSLPLLWWLVVNITLAITLCAVVKDYRQITYKSIRHIVEIMESSTHFGSVFVFCLPYVSEACDSFKSLLYPF